MQNCQSKWHGRIVFKRHLLTFVAFSLLLPNTGFSAGLTVKFIDNNPNYPASKVYVAFGGKSNAADFAATKVSDNSPLTLGTSYSLADLSQGIILTKFIGGRICFMLGKPFESIPNPGNDNNPNFNNSSLKDYRFRWDKAEVTYALNDPSSVINLSATDFFSVRLRIRTYNKQGALQGTLTWQKPIATAFHDTGLLSGFRVTQPGLAVCTDDENGVPTQGPNSTTINVLRVIAPSTIGVGVPNPYPSFAAYINHVMAKGTVTKIEGQFFGAPAATYKFTASVDSNGLLMTGTVTANSGPTSHVIKIKTDNLAEGIYTQDPTCNIDGVNKTPGNTPIGAAVRDILAGFSYGFVGSRTQNPNVPGQTYGDTTSTSWHSPNPAPLANVFAGAQPNNPYYNQYGAALTPITSAYGFPYSDFVQKPLAGLDPAAIGSMDITVLADQ